MVYGLAVVLAQMLPTDHRHRLILGLTKRHCFVPATPPTA
jgi:hypothetical protein